MSRYNRTDILSNSLEYYEYLRRKRGLKRVVQYATPILHNPTILQRATLLTTTHIWKYGDRYYNLAAKYYGDVRYWWVIAWYNSMPTEADIFPGDVIEIPVNISDALKVLEV